MSEKSLAQNSIFNVAYKLLNVLFPLVTSTYLGHILQASGVGKVTYAQNIVLYFTTLATLGIPYYGTREIAKTQNESEQRSRLFTELFTINGISTSICFAAYYTLILTSPYFANLRLLYAIAGLAIPFTYCNIEWLYQGMEEFKYIAIRSAAIKLVSLICVLTFIKSPSDLELYALIYCFATGANHVLNILHLRRIGVHFRFQGMQLAVHLKPIFILFASVIAMELYTMLDTTMLGILCADENVGYYTNATRLAKVLVGVITAIAAVLLPRLSYYYSNGKIEKCSELVNRVLHILLLLSLPCTAGLFALAPQIMPLLFGETFAPAATTLRIASFLIIAIGLSNLFGTQVLLTFGGETKLLICTIVGAVTNVLLNLILIPMYAQNGAAVASVISETIVSLISILYAGRYIRLKMNCRITVDIIVATGVMASAVLAVQSVTSSVLLNVVISVVVGVITYAAVNFIIRNPLMDEVMVTAKNMLRR